MDKGPAEVTSPPPSLHLRTWRIAGPVILANSSVPLLGAVDTAVLGHLPDPAYLGAIALGSLIFMFLYWGFNFLRMGTTGLTAQAWGSMKRGDKSPMPLGMVFARASVLSVGLGLLILALQIPIGWIAFRVFEADPAIEAMANSYFAIRIWSAPGTLLQFVVVGWLLGTQRARSAMVLQIFLNILNIILDVAFVVGLGWGIEGVAWGTLIAEYSAALLAIVMMLRYLRQDHGLKLSTLFARQSLFDPHEMGRLLRLNGDIFLRTICLLTAFGVFTAIGARLGTLVLAVNTVLMNFHHFMSFGLDGFAFAAEALVGEEEGERDREGFKRAVRVTSAWAFGASLLYCAVYGLGGNALVAALTDLDDVRALARDYLPWLALMPLIGVASYQLDGIFVGLTRGRDMRNTMVLSFIVYLGALAALVPAFGNHGLWAAFIIFLAARGTTLGWRLRQVATAPANS